MNGGDGELLRDLNDAQRAAVTSDAAPLCIIAGAGTGKTRVLTRRIAYRCQAGSADPRRVLALTFTRKAAAELATRLRALGLRDHVSAGTFHAMAYAQLRKRWDERQQRPPELLTRKGTILGPILRRRRGGRGRADITIADLAAEIEWAKARIVAPSDYATASLAAGRRPPGGPDVMASMYREYEDERRSRRMVDFDDLLDLCAGAIEADPEFAAAQRWQYRHLFVDEFQDVNPLQFRLLEAWRGDADDLCVVGDPNQAIYAWNGADPDLIRTFRRRFPTSAVVELDVNYRSTAQILATANAVLEGAVSEGVRLRPTRTPGTVPSIRVCGTDRAEARAVARSVLDHHGPHQPWSHQAVLVRTNAQALLFVEAFRAMRTPFRLRGAVPFTQLDEVRGALQELRRARTGFADGLARLEAWLDETPAAGEPDDALSDAEAARRENLTELLRHASDYSAVERSPTAAGFEAWLAAVVGSGDSGEARDAVEIATFHAAKGLEWPIVHLCGLEAGLVPIAYARTPEARAEERRLFYVAVTRAERELHLWWAEQRQFGTRVSARSRSPFLDEVAPVLDAMAAGASPADWRAHLPGARAALAAGPGRRTPPGKTLDDPADQALFTSLKQWRLAKARAANVPAFVIFADTTLSELARRRPADHKGLLAVSGIGPTKANRFGDEVLAVIAQHTASG